MKVKTKQVYYCEFCHRHRLVKSAIEKHEPVCTLNPNRICSWDIADHLRQNPLALLARVIKTDNEITNDHIESLRTFLEGCPACMLTVLRLTGLNWYGVWDFTEEVKQLREQEREESNYEMLNYF